MLSVVVPTLIGWQIQVRRNPLFINAANRRASVPDGAAIRIEAGLFHLLLQIASRGTLEEVAARITGTSRPLMDYCVARV
jgi:hypothetical protein